MTFRARIFWIIDSMEGLKRRHFEDLKEIMENYKMLINLRKGISEFKREGYMLTMLKSFLGDDASIEVEYVEEIPVLKSGKRKQVVNNFQL